MFHLWKNSIPWGERPKRDFKSFFVSFNIELVVFVVVKKKKRNKRLFSS